MSSMEWLSKLLVTAGLLGGYPAPPQAPKLTMLPQNELAALVCGGDCPVRGAYLHGRGILLSNKLDLDNDPMDRSVLLHEAVHYLQDINGRFADETACDRFREREIEAYDVQDRYLSRYGRGIGNVVSNLEWVPYMCRAGSAQAAQSDSKPPGLAQHIQ